MLEKILIVCCYFDYHPKTRLMDVKIGFGPSGKIEKVECKICNKVTTEKECKCGKDGFVEISGTKIRKAIVNKTKLPEIYIQKEILEELQKLDNPFIN